MEGDPGSSKKEDCKIEEAAMWLVLLPLFGFLKVEQPSGNETCNNRLTNCLKKRHIRAIRIRTVDLLGKTDQTDYYRNDSNCFKDPTCIFFALGSFIN
jgi:hypothetical protein